MPRYTYTSIYLSEIPRPKIGVACAKCGLVRRYDRERLLQRVGDWPAPTLLKVIARREGCGLAEKPDIGNPCGLAYDPPHEETRDEVEARMRRRAREG